MFVDLLYGDSTAFVEAAWSVDLTIAGQGSGFVGICCLEEEMWLEFFTGDVLTINPSNRLTDERGEQYANFRTIDLKGNY